MENPNSDKRGPKLPPPAPPQMGRPLMGWIVMIGLVLLAVALFGNQLNKRKEISYVDFWKYVENGQVVGTLLIRTDRIEGTLAKDTPGLSKEDGHEFVVIYPLMDRGENFDQRLQKALNEKNNPATPVFKPESWWSSLLPQLLLMVGVFLVIWFLVFRRLGAAGGGGGFLGNFGRSKHRLASKEQSRTTFADVAGVEEAKEEVAEIIEFLKNAKRFQKLGGRIPRGVLLVGEPGCGKTMLARAIAGEADVPFFSISGSDFVEMFVGVGASRVRDLFKQAKDSSPCIIFLDEIDAVGRRRGMGYNGGHDEREQTLNAILVEMDGFESNDQVIVIAATNRMDVLDPALTRPGRFDRQIEVPLPDLKGRCEILQIYINKIRVGADVDIKRLARGTPMFSGADLAALVNEAAIAATMANKDSVEMIDLEEARDKVRWGRARKSRVVDEQDREITAYHEAGHALIQLLQPNADPLHKVSIIPRGQAGGATFSLPEKDRYMHTRRWCEAHIRICIAGRIAEEIFCGDVSSGASMDIMQATEMARKMVLDWGMSERLGFIRYAPDPRKGGGLFDLNGREYSEKTAELIDEEIKLIVDRAYNDTQKTLKEHQSQLESLAQALLKYETLSAEEAQRIISGEGLDKPTVDDLLDLENAKSPPEAIKPSSPAPPDAE